MLSDRSEQDNERGRAWDQSRCRAESDQAPVGDRVVGGGRVVMVVVVMIVVVVPVAVLAAAQVVHEVLEARARE